jgi:hypothetical protein
MVTQCCDFLESKHSASFTRSGNKGVWESRDGGDRTQGRTLYFKVQDSRYSTTHVNLLREQCHDIRHLCATLYLTEFDHTKRLRTA